MADRTNHGFPDPDKLSRLDFLPIAALANLLWEREKRNCNYDFLGRSAGSDPLVYPELVGYRQPGLYFFPQIFGGKHINLEVLASCYKEWAANGIGVPGSTVLERILQAPQFFFMIGDLLLHYSDLLSLE